MKYVVDRALCAGHGQCAAVAPEVFDLDDEGFNARAGETVEVPDARRETARDGAGACPESAITLLD